MKALIDTVFYPVLSWLENIRQALLNAAVPDYYVIPIEKYIKPFTLLGPYWLIFISTLVVLSGIYGYLYVVSNGLGIFQRFKNLIKWW